MPQSFDSVPQLPSKMRTLSGIVFLLVAIAVCGCVSPVVTADTLDNLTMQTSSHHDLAAKLTQNPTYGFRLPAPFACNALVLEFLIGMAGFLVINMLFGAFAAPCCQKSRSISGICQRFTTPNFIHSSPAHKPSIAWADHRALLRFPFSANASILMMALCLFASPVTIAKNCEQVALASDRSELVAASLPSGLVFFAGGFTGATVLVFG